MKKEIAVRTGRKKRRRLRMWVWYLLCVPTAIGNILLIVKDYRFIWFYIPIIVAIALHGSELIYEGD